jgi:hypothetical protein
VQRNRAPGPFSDRKATVFCTRLHRPSRRHYLSGPPEPVCRLRLKCDCTRADTRRRLSAKRTSPFKSAGASVQSTTGSRGMRISDSNAGYTMFRGSVKSTDYPLNSSVSPSTPPPRASPCAITFQLDCTSDLEVRTCIKRKMNIFQPTFLLRNEQNFLCLI